MPRIVADLGNSRLKWGLVDAAGRVVRSCPLPLDAPDAWHAAWVEWGLDAESDRPAAWAVGSVNPPVAEAFGRFLAGQGVEAVRWFRSAADVPIGHALATPQTTGADRALAVLAASRGRSGPGLVAMCGTALTVERIGPEGVWHGGAIAAGLGLTARALHTLTAQLPQVDPGEQPPAWGDATRPALEAGIFWGVVGAARELLTRQAVDLGGEAFPWLVWSGGDAAVLARAVRWPGATVEPDLVLHGLAAAAFGPGPEPGDA